MSGGDREKSVGFPPVARRDARILILGSLPGVESLRRTQYYAKPQNAFWKIMGEVAGATPELAYAARLARLRARGIALWDVCAAAEREGSLDSAIRAPEANDFAAFFAAHRKIAAVFFNGQPAARLFRRLVVAELPAWAQALPVTILPSTSPAHAGMSYARKLAVWREALTPFLEP